MTTLSQLYKQKEKNGTGTAVNKTYIVPVAELYVEPGFNVREIDQEHVGEFRDAFIAGEYIPPLAVQVTEQGKPLTPIERGNAYQRLVNQGWEHAEIASKVKRSVSDVVMHIDLVACDEPLLNMVRSGEVAATTAVALSREHGPQAVSVASRQMDKAKASGKSKLTRNAALPQFSAAKARQFIQIVADQAGIALPDEARAILDAYREFLKEAGWESEA